MTKKINFRKIETMIPEDIFISNIAHLIGNVKNVTLEVRFDSINSFEVDDTMFVLLEMHDAACNKIKGLMVGARDNDFKALVKSINIENKYRVSGNVSLLDKGLYDEELPFKINDDRVFCIYALQNYGETLFGVDLDELYCNGDSKMAYNLVKSNTSYLNNISLEDVEMIEFSCYKDIIVLLKDGTLYINGEKKLDDIVYVALVDTNCVFAISTDRVITCLTSKKKDARDAINDHDYKYKKVIVTGTGIVALTYDRTVRYFGHMIRDCIFGEYLVDVDDIGIVDKYTSDVVVIKGAMAYSLFMTYPPYRVSDITLLSYCNRGGDFVI